MTILFDGGLEDNVWEPRRFIMPEAKARNRQVVALAQTGASRRDIAARFGISYTRVCQILKKARS